MDARLLCNSSFALGEGAGNETCRTKSTECLPTSNLFGALQVGTTSAAWPHAAVSGSLQVRETSTTSTVNGSLWRDLRPFWSRLRLI